ncbi:acetyltransferase [Bacillus sp. JCM 19047]|nr:acetyltransferase [Bacillus sp. JCM 19047]
MRVAVLNKHDFVEMRMLFLDVFTNDPWFDKWSSEEQLDAYMRDLTENTNSLSLALYDENDVLIGCSLGYVFNWWEGREYFIKEFFVSRKEQNQGVGSAFLELMDSKLKAIEIKFITLNTEKNVPAYRFYQKNRFSVSNESVFMVKRLAE